MPSPDSVEIAERLAGEFAAPVGVDQVDLGVDDQHGGVELRVGPDEIAKGWRGRVGRRVQMEDDIHARQCGEGELAHALLHEVAGVEETGEVVPDVLDVAVGAEPDGRQARRLGLGAHDGEVNADEAVQEGGLADVGGAGERDVAAVCHERR